MHSFIQEVLSKWYKSYLADIASTKKPEEENERKLRVIRYRVN